MYLREITEHNTIKEIDIYAIDLITHENIIKKCYNLETIIFHEYGKEDYKIIRQCGYLTELHNLHKLIHLVDPPYYNHVIIKDYTYIKSRNALIIYDLYHLDYPIFKEAKYINVMRGRGNFKNHIYDMLNRPCALQRIIFACYNYNKYNRPVNLCYTLRCFSVKVSLGNKHKYPHKLPYRCKTK